MLSRAQCCSSWRTSHISHMSQYVGSATNVSLRLTWHTHSITFDMQVQLPCFSSLCANKSNDLLCSCQLAVVAAGFRWEIVGLYGPRAKRKPVWRSQGSISGPRHGHGSVQLADGSQSIPIAASVCKLSHDICCVAEDNGRVAGWSFRFHGCCGGASELSLI